MKLDNFEYSFYFNQFIDLRPSLNFKVILNLVRIAYFKYEIL